MSLFNPLQFLTRSSSIIITTTRFASSAHRFLFNHPPTKITIRNYQTTRSQFTTTQLTNLIKSSSSSSSSRSNGLVASVFFRIKKCSSGNVVNLVLVSQPKRLINSSSSSSSRSSSNRIDEAERLRKKKSTVLYLSALGILVVASAYAAVPLYRIFCQSYSYGGTTSTHDTTRDLTQMKKHEDRLITIRFNADRSSSLMWNFRPEQTEIIVTPGETALAFYRAENKTKFPVDGISTYNVIPFEAGQYFNKIQCFCFEEQRLNPGETVELPVFFYIDPEFCEDPRMEHVDLITLSYTFFESKDMPGWYGVIGGGGSSGHGVSSKPQRI